MRSRVGRNSENYSSSGQVCHQWQQRGSCKFGSNCKFAHDPAGTNGKSGPRPPKGKPCFRWQNTGVCSNASCTYLHEKGDTRTTQKKPEPMEYWRIATSSTSKPIPDFATALKLLNSCIATLKDGDSYETLIICLASPKGLHRIDEIQQLLFRQGDHWGEEDKDFDATLLKLFTVVTEPTFVSSVLREYTNRVFTSLYNERDRLLATCVDLFFQHHLTTVSVRVLGSAVLLPIRFAKELMVRFRYAVEDSTMSTFIDQMTDRAGNYYQLNSDVHDPVYKGIVTGLKTLTDIQALSHKLTDPVERMPGALDDGDNDAEWAAAVEAPAVWEVEEFDLPGEVRIVLHSAKC